MKSIQSGDYELWLFKAPKSLQPSSLEHCTIVPGESLRVNNTHYNIIEGNEMDYDGLMNVWPDPSTQRLQLGQPFARMINITEGATLSAPPTDTLIGNLSSFLTLGTISSPHHSPSPKASHSQNFSSVSTQTSQSQSNSQPHIILDDKKEKKDKHKDKSKKKKKHKDKKK